MFKLNKVEKSIAALKRISYSEVGLMERRDIQEWVAKNPAILGEDILIIAKEFSGFDKTNERLDLAGLDKHGNVVIIELKRDDSGSDVTWQAIKYASYFSTLTTDEIYRIFSSYEGISEEEGKQIITEFLDEGAELNENQRIILLSREFRPEVTAAVMWLLNKGLLLKCVTIQPYLDESSDEILIVPAVILPPPNTDDYLIKVAKKEQEQSKIANERLTQSNDEITHFAMQVKAELQVDAKIANILNPLVTNRRAPEWEGLRFFHFWDRKGIYANHDCSYQINLSPIGRHVEKNIIIIRFRLRKKHAEQLGVLELFSDKLSDVQNTLGNDFSIQNSRGTIDIEKKIKYSSLDNDTKKVVVDSLIQLITTIDPIISHFNDQQIVDENEFED